MKLVLADSTKPNKGFAMVLALMIILVAAVTLASLLKESSENLEIANLSSTGLQLKEQALADAEQIRRAVLALVEANRNPLPGVETNYLDLLASTSFPSGVQVLPIGQGKGDNFQYQVTDSQDHYPKLFEVRIRSNLAKGHHDSNLQSQMELTQIISVDRGYLKDFSMIVTNQRDLPVRIGPNEFGSKVGVFFETTAPIGASAEYRTAMQRITEDDEMALILNTRGEGNISFGNSLITNLPTGTISEQSTVKFQESSGKQIQIPKGYHEDVQAPSLTGELSKLENEITNDMRITSFANAEPMAKIEIELGANDYGECQLRFKQNTCRTVYRWPDSCDRTELVSLEEGPSDCEPTSRVLCGIPRSQTITLQDGDVVSVDAKAVLTGAPTSRSQAANVCTRFSLIANADIQLQSSILKYDRHDGPHEPQMAIFAKDGADLIIDSKTKLLPPDRGAQQPVRSIEESVLHAYSAGETWIPKDHVSLKFENVSMIATGKTGGLNISPDVYTGDPDHPVQLGILETNGIQSFSNLPKTRTPYTNAGLTRIHGFNSVRMNFPNFENGATPPGFELQTSLALKSYVLSSSFKESELTAVLNN